MKIGLILPYTSVICIYIIIVLLLLQIGYMAYRDWFHITIYIYVICIYIIMLLFLQVRLWLLYWLYRAWSGCLCCSSDYSA